LKYLLKISLMSIPFVSIKWIGVCFIKW